MSFVEFTFAAQGVIHRTWLPCGCLRPSQVGMFRESIAKANAGPLFFPPTSSSSFHLPLPLSSAFFPFAFRRYFCIPIPTAPIA